MALSKKILLIAPPTTPGIASLAQCLKDADSDGLEAAWICHNAWSQPANFWTKTLAMLDGEPGSLPIFLGIKGKPLKIPGEWMADGYRLVIVGIAYEGDDHLGALAGKRHPLSLLHKASRSKRPVLYLDRSAKRHLEKRVSGPASIITTNHISACRLHNTELYSPLGKLAAVCNLAFEESSCDPIWLKRARGLVARTQVKGSWDDTVVEVLGKLCALDWQWLEEAGVPDLTLAQQDMISFRHSLFTVLKGLRTGWRQQALNDALEAAKLSYAIGVQENRNAKKLRLQVVRYWKEQSLPSVKERLGSLSFSIDWKCPTDNLFYSPWLSKEDLLDLAAEVVEALEKDQGALQSLRQRLSKEDWPSGSPAALLLEAAKRPTAPARLVESIIRAYRVAMFNDVHPETWHHFKGALNSGLIAPEPEVERDFLVRAGRFFKDSHFPWPAEVLGATNAQGDLDILGALAEEKIDVQSLESKADKAISFLDIMGAREEEVGCFSLGVFIREKEPKLVNLLCQIEEPSGVKTIIWPSTLSEMLEKSLHNMVKHGFNKACHPRGLLAAYYQGRHRAAFVTRHNGPGLSQPAINVIEAVRQRGHGGMEFIMRELKRYRGTGWIRDVESGYKFSGEKMEPLKREWIFIGKNPALGLAPPWLCITQVPDLTAGLELAEGARPGRFDGFILSDPNDLEIMSDKTWDRVLRWKWSRLFCICLAPLKAPGLRQRYLPPGELIEALAEEPGVEVGLLLPALMD